ncbi:MAG: ROK family protein [Verrucomicrobiales bacterium]|jgi:glucokinase|nr:ROK family protein [Verrucomicrobiales bacterium]
MADNANYFAGLDIGGTTVKTVLVDVRGEVAGEMIEVRSHVKDGYEATFGQLESALDQLTAAIGVTRDAVKGIGMDVPAPSCDGVIWGRANLAEDWVGTNIRDRLSERLGGTPIYMTNDGNAAALGEYAVRRKHIGGLLLVAPGTGLGGGLVLPGGRAYEGANGLALEVGHISSPFREDDGELPQCSCGKLGCLEAWVSLVALRRRIGLELAKPEHDDHPLNDGSPVEEKAFRLRDFAQEGDELANFLFQQQARILGYGIADLVRVFDPGLVVLGGGLAETEGFRDTYLDWMKEGFEERAWAMYSHSPIDPEKITTRFEWATGGDSAAALGVAFSAREMFR